MARKTVAVMQPYLFPYIGYFQLIFKSNVFVLYDNVQFIKGGWINRNNFLVNGERKTLTVPLISASSNKLINEIEVSSASKDVKKVLKSIYFNYYRSRNFEEVYPIVETVLGLNGPISVMALVGLKEILKYLDLDREIILSSEHFHDLMSLGREQRLIEIVKRLGGHSYINMEGGADMYSSKTFAKEKLELLFLKHEIIEYEQSNSKDFIGGLSIIDLLMNLSKEEVVNHLKSGQLLDGK